ncbi:MAG TPA: Rpn family recombination-promoting nuclease/putative transposase [bacterium]|nr:Rpn family recombination-promoting nuclease/putative transposase [bacterium]
MNMGIPNPHDRFFKETLSVKENALDFVSGVLPETLREKLDLSTLNIEPTSYVDNKLAESFSDIVYSCTFKHAAVVKISLLLEHKSSPDPYPHIQLLKYITNIWDQLRKQQRKPQIGIPIVLYHGKKRWRKGDMTSYFKESDNEFCRFIPSFEYILLDLSKYTHEQIKEGIFNRTAVKMWLLLQKHIFDTKRLERYLSDLLKLGILYYREPEGLRFLESVCRYIFFATDLETEIVLQAAQQIPEGGRELIMTTGEKLLKQGFEQGIEHAKLEDARKMIESGYRIEDICDITNLSKEIVETLKKQK